MTPQIPLTNTSLSWIWEHRVSFTIWATVFAAVLYTTLFGFGMVPEMLVYQPPADTSAQPSQSERLATTESNDDNADAGSAKELPRNTLPTRISMPSVGIDTRVLNPNSRDTSVLNSYLREAAVRYPRSGRPGNGNMFIFGHSTGRETVINPAYKTFNNLENLQAGDRISVRTRAGTFEYTVRSVQFKKDSAAYVPFDTDQNLLTIATCDNFGQKEDRVVVRAEFSRFSPETARNT